MNHNVLDDIKEIDIDLKYDENDNLNILKQKYDICIYYEHIAYNSQVVNNILFHNLESIMDNSTDNYAFERYEHFSFVYILGFLDNIKNAENLLYILNKYCKLYWIEVVKFKYKFNNSEISAKDRTRQVNALCGKELKDFKTVLLKEADKQVSNSCLDLNHIDVSEYGIIDFSHIENYKFDKIDITGWKTPKLRYISFSHCKNVSEIIGIGDLDVSKVTRMDGIFYGCQLLKRLDLSRWNVSRVTTMEKMFSDCSGLTELDMTGWNTSRVNDFSYMFDACKSVKKLDVSFFNVTRAKYMSGMFNKCWSLESVDMGSCYAKYCTTMDFFLYDCKNLKTLVLPRTSERLETVKHMMNGCVKLKEVDLTPLNENGIKSMNSMLGDCEALIKVKMDGLDVSNVVDVECMFASCISLKSLDLSEWILNPNCKKMDNMFHDCESLKEIRMFKKLPAWNESLLGMFGECGELENIYNISDWDVSDILEFDYMFDGCCELNDPDLSKWNIHDEATVYNMFAYCKFDYGY